jgi:hypothetical protein
LRFSSARACADAFRASAERHAKRRPRQRIDARRSRCTRRGQRPRTTTSRSTQPIVSSSPDIKSTALGRPSIANMPPSLLGFVFVQTEALNGNLRSAPQKCTRCAVWRIDVPDDCQGGLRRVRVFLRPSSNAMI